MSIVLNSDVDFNGYANRFAKKGRVRFEGLISDDEALRVHLGLEQRTPWALQLVTPSGMPDTISRAELETLSPPVIQDRLQACAEVAQTGLAYLRLGYNDFDELADDHAVKDMRDLIASVQFARLCEGLTGLSGLALITLDALCYRNGDFFTHHTDNDARLSFEWNFTRDWRSDWGGQVLFHSPSGDIEGGIMPRLNDLALFSGDQPISIASVSAFAGGPRFSIAGRMG